MTVVRQ